MKSFVFSCHPSLVTRHFSLLSFNSFHLSRTSPVRSLGSRSTGTSCSAQKVRQRRNRASNCPVSSVIVFITASLSERFLSPTVRPSHPLKFRAPAQREIL